MSVEQRIQAYYKANVQGWRNGHYAGRSAGNFFMHIAQKFKRPIREVREILGKRPPRPPFPGVPEHCVDEEDGRCVGRLVWRWGHEDQRWNAHCSNHFPEWREYVKIYGEDRMNEMMEDRMTGASRGLNLDNWWMQ